MRRLLVGAGALIGLLLVADRAGAALAERAIAAQVQRTAGLAEVPSVDVTGFPFLTQALSGRYTRVEVEATGVPAGELRLASLAATLTGVRVPLSDALSGSVGAVPVEGLTTRSLVPYDELARSSGDRGLTVMPSGDRVRVRGTLDVLGAELAVAAVSRVEVVDGQLLVTAEDYEVGTDLGDAVVTRVLGDRLDLDVPVDLPYGLTVAGVDVLPGGIEVRAAAVDVLLR